ncbi:MAG TPA: UvrD-helicase domain-containing protein, partial [bacterium]|nr:UvrD-helicase domain-containing protein [bacterium]
RYIMIDEYQDTNKTQFELIKLLSSHHGNIFVVGDDDQSIYSWRGADIENILNFEKDFKKSRVIKLEENYRSVDEIVNAAGR